MQGFAVCLTLLAFATTLCGQGPTSGPSIDSEEPNYTYAGNYVSLGAINWRNFKMVEWSGADSKTYQLHHGRYEHGPAGDTQEATLSQAHSFRDGAREFAVLEWSEMSCGGSCAPNGIVQLVELCDHKLVLVQQLVYQNNSMRAGSEFSQSTHKLTI